MGDKNKTILVAGATGKQGGATARRLLENGWPVSAITRNPDQPAAKELSRLGAKLVKCNLNDRKEIDEVIKGCYGVFSVQTFAEEGLEGEVQQGKILADAAKQAGVAHFVYSSVGSADQDTGIPHFESKYRIERYIRSIDIPATILRPVFFMENFNAEETKRSILDGKLQLPINRNRPLQMIAVDDIGAFALMAFEKPNEFIGRDLDLAGDELTMPKAAETFGRVLGRPVRYVEQPVEQVRRASREMGMMFDWFNDVGYSADIAALREIYPELKTLEAWLYEMHWDALAVESNIEGL